ncbi:unnamed protein product [Heligmosomoides polygyrus]|uniref:DDE_Tnp_1 domain-containing protein n=1 Tax=Heligmosomoides polygyrus TaxID=6339 RepID=A0A183FYE6_HELPZ|nr:unnamed protein product [Heligmosomoides polygyrus]
MNFSREAPQTQGKRGFVQEVRTDAEPKSKLWNLKGHDNSGKGKEADMATPLLRLRPVFHRHNTTAACVLTADRNY